jgi:hypothetical protein
MHLPTKPRKICLSGVSNPPVHTVAAPATSGAVVAARPTDQCATLPPD